MTTLKQAAERAGSHMPEAHIVTMDDAMAAGNGVLIEEQAALLRECRAALDDLLKKKPMMTALICGSTTLGNLRASLYEYRPQGVIGSAEAIRARGQK
jgi:hypothetical protein